MVVFVVEGKTDIEFFRDFMNEFGISKDKYEFKNFEGKDNIFKLSHKLYDEIENELDIIDKIFIAVDADDPKDKSPIRGYQETQNRLKKLIEALGFDIPIDYFIFSDRKKEKGYLESFLYLYWMMSNKNVLKNLKSVISMG